MGAGKGNKNAEKEVKADQKLYIRVTEKQKERWSKLAKKKAMTLSAWVIEKLDS